MERSRRKRGRGPGWKEKEEGRVTGKWKTNRTSRQWVWLDFQAAISRGSTFSWLAFVVRSLVSRRLHRCVRLSFLRFRTGTRLDFIRVHACVDVSARRPHFSTGTCSLNKRTAHALSRFHLDRSNEKRRNETTRRYGSQSVKTGESPDVRYTRNSANNRPQVYDAHVRILCHFPSFFSLFQHRHLHASKIPTNQSFFHPYRDALFIQPPLGRLLF